ncbi:MAG: acetate--CoA ligase family protein, partial [Bacteroidota bacterium]
SGYLRPEMIRELLISANIPVAEEAVVTNVDVAKKTAVQFGFPLVMKVVGPVHKTDVGGVSLNIKTIEEVEFEFNKLMKLKDAVAVQMQKMISGVELFAGAKYEKDFGHLILCGLGGIYVEVLKDISFALAPLTKDEALRMIRNLKAYKMFSGVRGKAPIKEEIFAEILVNLSYLVTVAPEIKEMDLNPLLADGDSIVAVDARIRIEK